MVNNNRVNNAYNSDNHKMCLRMAWKIAKKLVHIVLYILQKVSSLLYQFNDFHKKVSRKDFKRKLIDAGPFFMC